jgi:hypothetical protein
VLWLLAALILAASPAWAGQLDASWTAPTTNTDGSSLDPTTLTYRVYWFLFPNTPCPGTQFIVTNPNTTGAHLAGLTAGMSYNAQVTAVSPSGNESACSNMATAVARADTGAPPPGSNLRISFVPSPPPVPVTFGETAILPESDSGNGNLLLAQSATLTTPGTLQSLSFYVTGVAGLLRLGLYSNVGGAPGVKLAETAAFTPVVGWNTQPVLAPASLSSGTYWLAYLPQSSALAFRVDTTSGMIRWVPFIFGVMPATFPTSGVTTEAHHWSLYGTLK